MKMFSKNLEDYSLETVMQFFNDAKDSGFKINVKDPYSPMNREINPTMI